MTRPFEHLPDDEVRRIAAMNPRHAQTLGGDLLDDDGNPTGHKLRGMNGARVIARMEARSELARRGSATTGEEEQRP